MPRTPIVFVLFAATISSAWGAEDWRKILAAPAVKLSQGKMLYEGIELCTLRRSSQREPPTNLQVRTRSEAPAGKFISRDNFIAITVSASVALMERLGQPECKTLDRVIGQPDIEVKVVMTEAGFQIEVSDTRTGQTNRQTSRWEDVFAK